MHFWGTWIFLFYITSAHAEGLPIVAESRVGSYRCADFSDQVRCNAKDGCHWRSEFWPPTCHEYKDKSAEHPTAQSENECVGLVIEECSNLDRCTWQEEYWPHGCERKAAYEARTRNSDGTLQRGDEGADQQDDAKIVSRNLNGFAQHHDAGQNDDMEIVPRNRDDVVRHDGNGYENHGHRRVAQDDDIDVVSRDRVKAVHHDIEAPDYNGLFQQIFEQEDGHTTQNCTQLNLLDDRDACLNVGGIWQEEFWPNRCMCKEDHEHQDHNEEIEHYGSARRGDQDSEEIDEVQETVGR